MEKNEKLPTTLRGFMHIFLLLILLSYPNLVYASPINEDCFRDPLVVDECFQIKGKAYVAANLRAYILAEKSHRHFPLAFISENEDAPLSIPQNLHDLLSPQQDVVGVFLACPLSKTVKGKQQIICIARAENLIKQKAK